MSIDKESLGHFDDATHKFDNAIANMGIAFLKARRAWSRDEDKTLRLMRVVTPMFMAIASQVETMCDQVEAMLRDVE